MRILIDARSVRTPSGRYILQGLAAGWRDDTRVSAVIAAVPRGFLMSDLPDGVAPMRVASSNWATHLLTELPRAADRARADVVFCPNGIGPADPRVVVFLQDMYHFAFKAASSSAPQVALQRAIRLGIRALSHRHFKVVIAVSGTIAREAERRFRLPIEIVPNGVDVDGLRWTGGDSAVVVLGGIGARKDEQTAVKAWSLVKERPKGVTLTIVGVEPKTRRMSLRMLARQLGIASSVSVRGTVSRPRYLGHLSKCHVAISCSRLESFGLPVAEALVMGAPLACSNIDAHADLAASAGGGTLFAVGNAAELAEIIEAALAGNPPSRTSGSLEGWDWASRAAQHVDVFQRYLGRDVPSHFTASISSIKP
jgi:glycosyltransferase involved in cell wall biosynthesis